LPQLGTPTGEGTSYESLLATDEFSSRAALSPADTGDALLRDCRSYD
jgi:hypothetical protein